MTKNKDFTFSNVKVIDSSHNSIDIIFKGNYKGTVNVTYITVIYPEIEPLQMPRIFEIPYDNTCHFFSVASVEAYALGMKYTYGGLSRIYTSGNDYNAYNSTYVVGGKGKGNEVDPVIKMMFDKKGFDDVDPINILSKIEIPFKTVTDDVSNNEATYKSIYAQLKSGKPVVIYANGNSFPHASVIVACKANKNTVTADDLIVMEIVNSWKNSQNLLNDCLTQDSTRGDDYTSCYMTLNAWLNNDNRKLIRYSYPVKIEK